MWREKKNGRFRWILFDTDFGFGLPGYEYLGDSNLNMIDWCSAKGKKFWANQKSWMTEIFSSLYQFDLFRTHKCMLFPAE